MSGFNEGLRDNIKEISQASIVVKDLDLAMMDYWDILGIGKWTTFLFGSPLVSEYSYHGEPTWARTKVAITQLGSLELELIQPLEGKSIYQEWIDSHGEGLHHLKFFVNDVSKFEQAMANKGFYSIQRGYFGPNNEYSFSFYDIKQLKTIWEVTDWRGGAPVGTAQKTIIEKGISPAKIQVQKIQQVALAVSDIQKTVENYWNILGLGPWEIRALEYPMVKSRTYNGKPSWSREKTAHLFLDKMDLELVQTVDGSSCYQDWIDSHGEGLHHFKFQVNQDVDDIASILKNQGFPSLQSGRTTESKSEGGCYHYIYIEPTHAIWEPVFPYKGGRRDRPVFYPPELAYDVELTKFK